MAIRYSLWLAVPWYNDCDMYSYDTRLWYKGNYMCSKAYGTSKVFYYTPLYRILWISYDSIFKQ